MLFVTAPVNKRVKASQTISTEQLVVLRLPSDSFWFTTDSEESSQPDTKVADESFIVERFI